VPLWGAPFRTPQGLFIGILVGDFAQRSQVAELQKRLAAQAGAQPTPLRSWAGVAQNWLAVDGASPRPAEAAGRVRADARAVE